jgi:hypothetical protein
LDAHGTCKEAANAGDALALAGAQTTEATSRRTAAAQRKKEKDGKGVEGVKGVELLRNRARQ